MDSRPRCAAARPEALPGADDIVARGLLQQRLIAAVLALDEPYRSTVLRRYLDDEPTARPSPVWVSGSTWTSSA